MYTQSSLRMLCKVASVINSMDDTDYYDFMEKYAGRTFDGRSGKERFRKRTEGARRANTKPMAEALATQAADPGSNISLTPVKDKPGHFMMTSPANTAAVEATKGIQKELQEMSPEARANLAANNEKALSNAQAKLDRVPDVKADPRKNTRRRTAEQASIDAKGKRTNLDIAKQEKAMVGGRGGRTIKPLTDAQRGGTLPKVKGGKIVKDTSGNVVLNREYLSPKAVGDNLARANRAARNAVKSSRIQRLLSRLGGPKGKLIAGILGGTALVGGGTAAAVSAGSGSTSPVAPVESTPTTAPTPVRSDNYDLYSNIGTGASGVAGYMAGHGISNALGGNTATNILMGLISGAGASYAGRKGTQWLLDKGYIG